MSSLNQTDTAPSSSSSLISNSFYLIGISTFAAFCVYKYIFRSKKQIKTNSIVIIGPSQSEKTSFFYYLLGKEKTETVVSMQMNEVDNFKSKFLKSSYDLIDIPGQGYFKESILENIQEAKMILLFVDSTERSSIVTAGEYLYDILNSDKFNVNVPFVIVCNKQDMNLPKNKKMIENNLATELENIKQIKQKNQLDDNAQVGVMFNMKQKFSFSMFKNIKFVESDKTSKYEGLIETMNKLLDDN